MTDECDYFSNSNGLPVEELTLSVSTAGVVQQIKALDPYWVEKRELTLYEQPPSGTSLVLGSLDAWKGRMQGCLEDLKWLLAMEHHCFWSTIIHHPQCMDLLVSFIQEANPPYMRPYEDKKVRNMYEDIRKNVLIVFSRLITNVESKERRMSKEFMKELIYDKFIFTVPILWDIALIYGTDNRQHVQRLITSVFSLQPRYLIDLEAAIVFAKESFKYIIIKVNKDYDNVDPPNLPETFKGFNEIKRPPNSPAVVDSENMNFNILKDLVIHLLDTVLTIRIFTELYPATVDVLKRRGFVLSEVQLYEHAIPCLYEKLDELGDQTSISYTEIEGYIDSARAELVDIFREILASSKNAIFSGEGSIENHVEDYLGVIMDGLSERLLIKDYHGCYPLHEDLDLLKQAYPNIDTVKTDFILQAIYSNIDDTIPDTFLNISEPKIPVINGHIDNTDITPSTSTEHEIPSSIKEDSLISEVKDIFPNLGEGFILKCLQHYNFDSAKVINCILEDNLDQKLRSIDRLLPIIPEDPLDKNFLDTGMERLNVFDGDEFDIMTRDDVDVSRIHVGKRRSKYKDLKDMLDDKADVKTRSDIYNKYNMVCDEVGMYSDEYDDTYDDDGGPPVVAGAGADADADDARRPLVTPRVLRPREPRPEVESQSESEHEDEAKASAGGRRVEFCANPEEARARREANAQQRQNKRSKAPPKPTDVVGKAKGQGQEKEVLVSRERKEKHKSSRANHNRRHGAQWKRSQGMVPS